MNIQALSSMLVNSHIHDDDDDNHDDNDHDKQISFSYKSITLQRWPVNAGLLIVELILYCIVATKTDYS